MFIICDSAKEGMSANTETEDKIVSFHVKESVLRKVFAAGASLIVISIPFGIGYVLVSNWYNAGPFSVILDIGLITASIPSYYFVYKEIASRRVRIEENA